MVGELGVPSAGLGVTLGGWHQCCDEGNLPLRNEGGAIELEVVVRGGDDTLQIVTAHSVVVVWDFEEGWRERVC